MVNPKTLARIVAGKPPSRKPLKLWKCTVARIGVDGKQIHLGTFRFEIDAVICYNYHAAHYFGDFARLNRIPDGEYPHD
jgi:hypothetical protein